MYRAKERRGNEQRPRSRRRASRRNGSVPRSSARHLYRFHSIAVIGQLWNGWEEGRTPPIIHGDGERC